MKKFLFLIFLSVMMAACAAQPVTTQPTVVPETPVVTATPTYQPVLRNTPISFPAPMVMMAVADMAFGDLPDVWECQNVSLDGKRCLDYGYHGPVMYTYNSVYGAPNPAIHISSRDMNTSEVPYSSTLTHEKKFEVKVEETSVVADYGQCVLAYVTYEVITDHATGARGDMGIDITICFDGKTWYASLPQ